MGKEIIATKGAPQAIGTYSQAVKVNDTVYLSGQIPLDPETMELCNGGFYDRVVQVVKNLKEVAQASGGDLKDIVKLNVYLTDLSTFSVVNKAMENYWKKPFPARACVEVSALPKDVDVEMDAVMVLSAES
jgi:reactive intermediate/imine deaminase